MMDRKSLLRQKFARNQRRLNRPNRLETLAAKGLRVSALGVDQHELIAATLRPRFVDDDWRSISATELASELSELAGDRDTLIVFDWHLDDVPGVVAARNRVVELIATTPEIFSLDGFIAVDDEASQALFLDIEEDGALSIRRTELLDKE